MCMWRVIKQLIRKVTPRKVKEFFAYQPGDEFATKSYSQEGEDILLKRIFENEPPGFYVDVGAHHPFRFSNTKLLYDRGWRGINIEPNPDVKNIFERHRPEDINICAGISDTETVLKYHEFTHSAANTFNEEIAEVKNRYLKNIRDVKVRPLQSVLEEFLPKKTKIDLLTIDSEGFDLKVLKSLNWEEYRPRVIMVEIFNLELTDLSQEPIYKFLNGKNYMLISKLKNSCLFMKN